jgi:thiol:disulfide interchange protein
VSPEAEIGKPLDLVADVTWLECADICIPGGVKLALRVQVAQSAIDSADASAIATAIAALPTRFAGTTKLTDLGKGGLQLVVTGIDTPRAASFFPYEVKDGALIDFAQPQELVRGKDGFGLNLVKSPSFPTSLSGDVGGVLVLGKGSSAKAFEVSAPLSTTSTALIPDAEQGASIGVFAALGLAFLGGLLLNIMPCVFPILSMKILSLMKASHNKTQARAHGLWYGAGVLASFLALAGILIGLQQAGEAIGWGFQLQSPAIVLGLAVVMTLVGFNLLGFFEFGTSLQNLGGAQIKADSASGSALTGALAVVVAAPCTAPFMGVALGFAATQPPLTALAIFASLGIGFALPFVALSFAPTLLSAFPKPGAWMVRFKEAMAFPMFATAIWLIWVVSAQAGQAGVLAALAAILGAGLAIWIARTWQGRIGTAFGLLLMIGALAWSIVHVLRAAPTSTATNPQSEFGEAWSPQRVAELQGDGKTVFVNFTADWCVTCKVNEVSVFSQADVRAAFSGGDVVYLVADWTRRDATIAQALSDYNRVGVPLYLVYKPGEPKAKVLPQILTSGIILNALK